MFKLHYRWSYYAKHPDELFKELVWYPFKGFCFWLKHGFKQSDTWNLDFAMAKWILPRLKYHRNSMHGWPQKDGDPYCETFEDWQKTIDKMIWSFEDLIAEGTHEEWYKQFELETEHFNEIFKQNFKDVDYEKMSRHYLRRQEGLELFGKFLQNLWN